MKKEQLKAAAFWLAIAIILALGFSVVVGPNASDIREAFLQMVTQEGSPFRFIFEPLLQRPAKQQPGETAAPEADPAQSQPPQEDLAPGETPVLQFDTPGFDPDPEEMPPSATARPSVPSQDTLPSDVLKP